ncbi:ty3-gypsy retrotransposon protein [Tanacetum coccineum]
MELVGQVVTMRRKVPTALSPHRSIDHRIHLYPNTKPMNVCPYRYPHYQKGEMEKLVNEMMSHGIIRDHKFYVKQSKCVFEESSLKYLGHIISGKGVEMDFKKVVAVREWHVPTNQRQVREFLRLAGYYRHFIKDYATIATPLSSLLQKQGFRWGALGVTNGVADALSRVFEDEEAITEFHNTPTVGHSEVKRMLVGLSALFYRKGMRKLVEEFIGMCLKCQQTKYSTQALGGLLQPLLTPSRVWEDVSMDFITGLPAYKGLSVIFVVVDRFTKYAHFGPLPTSFNVPKDVEFNIGDMVLNKLQSYHQVTVAKRHSNKMAKRYYEPFKVLERVGKVAYRLALPDFSNIHPVLHVSLLKQFLGTYQVQVAALPDKDHEGLPMEQPLAICDTRVVLPKGIPTRQVLVQWSGSYPK